MNFENTHVTTPPVFTKSAATSSELRCEVRHGGELLRLQEQVRSRSLAPDALRRAPSRYSKSACSGDRG